MVPSERGFSLKASQRAPCFARKVVVYSESARGVKPIGGADPHDPQATVAVVGRAAQIDRRKPAAGGGDRLPPRNARPGPKTEARRPAFTIMRLRVVQPIIILLLERALFSTLLCVALARAWEA
jgi:hypothetical protein